MRIRKLNKDSGMVLVMVLMAIMVMSVYVISILSQSLNQGTSTQAQIDRIKAQQLAKGAFWKAHSDYVGMGTVAVNFTEILDGKTFTVAGSTTVGVGTYSIDVSY